MTEEHLEGVLSDAKLDELAVDLGISPDVMRKHPFFRVMKGRVLLTYPLKSASPPEFQEPATFSQADPTSGLDYEVLNISSGDGGVLYSAWVKSDDAVTAVTKAMKLNIDGTTEILVQQTGEAGVEYWYLTNFEGLEKSAPGMVNIPFNESIKVEVLVVPALAGGKILSSKVWYGEQI